MHTSESGRAWPSVSDREVPEDTARLIPVVTRAAELGRGPAWLVQWVHVRLAGLAERGAIRDPAVIRRLARDLAGLLRPSGLADTVTDRV